MSLAILATRWAPADGFAIAPRPDHRVATSAHGPNVQQEQPDEDRVSNWLPRRATSSAFNIRAYWPLPPIQDGQWTPPPVCLPELTQIVPALAIAA